MNDTDSSESVLVPVLVPMRVRALKLSSQLINSTNFKYYANNYERLQQTNQSQLPEPGDYTSLNAGGVRLHWQLPSALRHGSPGSVLGVLIGDTPKNQDMIQQIRLQLRGEPTTRTQPLFWCFNSNLNLRLSEGYTFTCVNTDPDFVWQISSWADARHYLLREISQKGTQPVALEVRDARISFPTVPNRWLILRTIYPVTSDPMVPLGQDQNVPKMQAWLIESDTLNDQASCQFLLPETNAQSSNSGSVLPPKVVHIGKVYDLDEPDSTQSGWQEGARKLSMFLTAVGPGDPTFSVFAPSSENVFTFMDNKLSSSDGPTSITYQVYGWYANPKYDILCDKDVPFILQQLGWVFSTPPDCSESTQYQTILHGVVHSLKYNTADEQHDDSEKPSITGPIQLAVGNSTAEALTAYLAGLNPNRFDPSVLEKLNSLQFGCLDHFNRPSGREIAAQKLAESRFASLPGGLYWEIRSTDDGSGDSKDQDLVQQFSGDLAVLNKEQNAIDALQRSVASNQWKLHSILFRLKTNRATTQDPPQKDIIDNLRKVIAAGLIKLGQSNKRLQNLRRDLSTKLGSDMRIIPKPSARFWHPNDPVVLIEGLGNPDRETSPLPCRLLDQCVRHQDEVASEQLRKSLPYTNNIPDIPRAVSVLFEENYHLYHQYYDSQISSLCGNPPDPRAFQLWKQPWAPVFMDWRLSWYPTDRSAWKFDGDKYKADVQTIDQKIVQVYSGRTILSEHAVDNLNAQISLLLNQQTSDSDGQDLAKQLQTLLAEKRILSQRLSGFLDQLVTRLPNLSLPPVGDDANFIHDQYHTIPDLSKVNEGQDTSANMRTFYPEMGGVFMITNLEVIDLFGQCISLLESNSVGSHQSICRAQAIIPESKPMIISEDHSTNLTSNLLQNLLQLPLGLIQPAQLVMRWIDAYDNSKEVGLTQDANPVCGWLLPNHLDHSIAFYDSQGHFLGEVGGSTPQWIPSPECGDAHMGDFTATQSIVQKIIGRLTVESPDGLSSLDQWLTAIDETLWVIDPLGAGGDPDLSTLIGRPLVILRLKLALLLNGDPYTNERHVLIDVEPDDNGITQMPFSVKLGNPSLPQDGLVGFFLNDNYTTLHVVRGSSGISTANPVNTAAFPSNPQSTHIAYATFLELFPSSGGNDIYVTVLMDPRGTLHASTGILPVKEITIPAHFIEKPLSSMHLWFKIRSLLTPVNSLSVPRISEQNGKWEWWQIDDSGKWYNQPVTFSSSNATLSAATLAVRDGWLKLVPQQIDS